jgi:hypothetical protein
MGGQQRALAAVENDREQPGWGSHNRMMPRAMFNFFVDTDFCAGDTQNVAAADPVVTDAETPSDQSRSNLERHAKAA